MENKEIIAEGVSALYAVQVPHDSAGPQLFFCHPDSSYTCVSFRPQRTHWVHSTTGKLQDLPLLQNAVHFDKSWMNIRGTPAGNLYELSRVCSVVLLAMLRAFLAVRVVTPCAML